MPEVQLGSCWLCPEICDIIAALGLPYLWVIVVVHRLHSYVGQLIAFLHWLLAQPLKYYDLVLRKGAFSSDPAHFLQVLGPKCVLSSATET